MRLNPISTIEARLGIEPNGKVQKFFTNACYKHMDKYVPIDTGDLASNNVELRADSITYNSSYAHYMYEGKVMGPNIPIFTKGVKEPVGFYSPPKKHYTGKNIDYSKSVAKGHTYAGPYWDQRMKSAEITQVVNEVQNAIRSGRL